MVIRSPGTTERIGEDTQNRGCCLTLSTTLRSPVLGWPALAVPVIHSGHGKRCPLYGGLLFLKISSLLRQFFLAITYLLRCPIHIPDKLRPMLLHLAVLLDWSNHTLEGSVTVFGQYADWSCIQTSGFCVHVNAKRGKLCSVWSLVVYSTHNSVNQRPHEPLPKKRQDIVQGMTSTYKNLLITVYLNYRDCWF
jgi:hypothetical protein